MLDNSDGVVAIRCVVWTSASAENDAAFCCLLDKAQKKFATFTDKKGHVGLHLLRA